MRIAINGIGSGGENGAYSGGESHEACSRDIRVRDGRVGSARARADDLHGRGDRRTPPKRFQVEAESENALSVSIGARATLPVDDTDDLLAFGVDWKIGKLDDALRLRLQYERLYFPFSDASTATVGVAYHFEDLF
jgi:hypothetical protein